MTRRDSEFFAAVLDSGVDEWNSWRKKDPTIWPNLFEVRRPGVDLTGINLDSANLYAANFQAAKLRRANLRNTNLKDARLARADLIGADLSESNLHNADLRYADLRWVNLRDANLTFARLDHARVDGAVLGATSLGQTSLAKVKGFETIFHVSDAPSSIDLATLEATIQGLRSDPRRLALFRRLATKMGVPEELADYYPRDEGTTRWRSCFISYSSKDGRFVSRLDAGLGAVQVPRFFAPRASSPGVSIKEQIEAEIALRDRVLVVCSESALRSRWVRFEVDFAVRKKRATGDEVIFPLDIDGHLLQNPPKGKIVELLREQVVADFQGWESNEQKFANSLSRVIDALRR